MKKLAVIAGMFGIILFLGLLIIGGFGDGKPAPVPTKEEYCYNYQYTAYKLEIGWEISLIVDLYNTQRNANITIEEQNYLITSLNFVKLKEDVYREETEEEEDGSTSTYYVFEETIYHTGAEEIMSHLGIKQTERSVDKVLSAVESRQSQEHRYSWEQETDVLTVLNRYYSYFTELEITNMMQIYESHYYAAIYGNPFGTPDNEVYLGDLEFAANGMSIPLFRQYDPQWSGVAFGGGNISSSGCSVTSMAMVFTYLLDETILPSTIVAWTGNKYYVAPAGQSWSIFPACASHWNVTCQNLGKSSAAVVNALSAGQPVIASMAPGTFTRGGHFIVLRGITEEGKILVNDPNDNASKNFVNRQFDLNLIMRESKNFWCFY